MTRTLLLLDEPSAGLAPAFVDAIFEKTEEVNRDGVTVMMVEQNARRALAMSDRGYVLDLGKDRFEGPGQELLDDPKVAELYLGGTARIDQPRRGARVRVSEVGRAPEGPRRLPASDASSRPRTLRPNYPHCFRSSGASHEKGRSPEGPGLLLTSIGATGSGIRSRHLHLVRRARAPCP